MTTLEGRPTREEQPLRLPRRYALYFAPGPSSAWWRFGAQWLGRNPASGARCGQPEMDGVDAALFHRLTEAPRRYGFHATLKAPFRLAPGKTLTMLSTQLDAFCAQQSVFSLEAPAPLRLGDFLALAWPAADARAAAAGAACVTQFDHFRAPLSEADRARRRAAGLGAREDELLLRWGYPHVLEQFRMHLSLTGALGDTPPQQVQAMLQAARAQMDALGAASMLFDGISIFEEPKPGADLRIVHRSRFGAAGGGRLVYVAGPSGAGKDSVIEFARQHLPPGAKVRFAQRTITRPADTGG